MPPQWKEYMYNIEKENHLSSQLLCYSPCMPLKPINHFLLYWWGETFFGWSLPVILFQKSMVSPGTHLVKNHESQYRFPVKKEKKKKTSPNWKCLDLYEDWLQNSVLQHTEYILNTSSDWLTSLCVLWNACLELFCILKNFYASGMQDAEVTKSLHYFYSLQLYTWLGSN